MAPLGLDGDAEQLYRTLLRHPDITTEALAEHLAPAAGRDTLEARLETLQRRGLLARSSSAGGGPARWRATSPEVAIELLLMERQSELIEARRVLPELQRDLLESRAPTGQGLVQVLPEGHDAQLGAYLKLLHDARHEIATVVRPPFGVSDPDAMNSAREQALQRGVRIRTLVAPELMSLPGWEAGLRSAQAQGGEIRMLADIPFKMLLADREAGLVPLRSGSAEGEVLWMGPVVVLAALWEVFEIWWERAAPALERAGRTGGAPRPDDDLADPETLALLTLLSAGTNDKSIADILGISERTLMRRIGALGTRLQARSRFQCGWLAARRLGGLLP